MLSISIVIPTLNNQGDLSVVLQSIRIQSYPKTLVEIIICDGGSTDETIHIAERFKCKIYHNSKKLAEYGVALGFQKAKGQIIMVLAADNELGDKYFLQRITKPFEKDENIILSYPRQDSRKYDIWITKYINTFTDPINHFIYGNASNTRTFERIYETVKKTKDYIIYNFSRVDYPMVALAQGTAVRSTWKREEVDFGDDILSIVHMIDKHYAFAYVPGAVLYHHSVKFFGYFINKMRWAMDNYLVKAPYGINVRLHYFSWKRQLRKYIWPFYALSIIFPIGRAVVGGIMDREILWIYHPVLTYLSLVALVWEFIRVKICRQSGINRK